MGSWLHWTTKTGKDTQNPIKYIIYLTEFELSGFLVMFLAYDILQRLTLLLPLGVIGKALSYYVTYSWGSCAPSRRCRITSGQLVLLDTLPIRAILPIFSFTDGIMNEMVHPLHGIPVSYWHYFPWPYRLPNRPVRQFLTRGGNRRYRDCIIFACH